MLDLGYRAVDIAESSTLITFREISSSMARPECSELAARNLFNRKATSRLSTNQDGPLSCWKTSDDTWTSTSNLSHRTEYSFARLLNVLLAWSRESTSPFTRASDSTWDDRLLLLIISLICVRSTLTRVFLEVAFRALRVSGVASRLRF